MGTEDINNKIISDIHWDLEDAKGVVSNHVCIKQYERGKTEAQRSSTFSPAHWAEKLPFYILYLLMFHTSDFIYRKIEFHS